LGHTAQAGAAYRYFSTLTASKWEGNGRAADDDLEKWLMEVLPIHWPKGQQSLLSGLRLARKMAGQA